MTQRIGAPARVLLWDERARGAGVTFDEFVESKLPTLLRFAATLCVDRGTAEDVSQEVLMRAHARWAEIGRLDRPEFYVRRMIVNEYLSWRRKWSRQIPIGDAAAGSQMRDPTAVVGDRAELVAAIKGLPPRQRAVVVMRFFGEMTDAEIAADLGCSEGTVRSHASRALAALRVRIDEADRSTAR